MAQQAAALYATVSIAGADKSVRDLRNVGGAVTNTQRTMSGLGKNAGVIAGGVGDVGKGLLRIGEVAAVAVLGAGVAATRVAINFQDAYKGIQKTVQGTPAELDALNSSLKSLSTRIPVKYTDLANIAQEAGALGVKVKDVDAFTEAVARTVAATVGLDNATASEAFGKLGTVFGFQGKQYNQLGSVLVELGNNAASTEADIVSVTLRFAAAGRQAGLSAAQVLGWSSAIASLGPEAEAAGSALSRVFNRLTQNVALMGNKDAKGKNAKTRVDAFAAVTGLSVKEFVALYTKDSSGAMTLFLQNLGKLDKFSASRALVAAGIVNVRDINSVLLLAHQTGVLTSSLQTANTAWDQNTALVTVSDKRFSGLKSTLTELWNTVLVGADAFGSGLIPAIGRLAEKARAFTLGHLNDLRTFGKDVGAEIDKVDWTRVESDAMRVVAVAETLLGVIKKIPPEIAIGVAAFLGINKVSGGLIGQGTGGIAKGILGMGATIGGALIRGIGGKLGGVVGGALGAVGATPVYVVNWPAVGGFGGGLPDIVGGAAAAGGAGILAMGSVIAAAAAASIFAFLNLEHGPKAGPGAYTPTVGAAFAPPSVTPSAFSGIDWATIAGNLKSGKTPDDPGYARPGVAAGTYNYDAHWARDARQAMQGFQGSVGNFTDRLLSASERLYRDSNRKRGTALVGDRAKAAGYQTRTGFLQTGKPADVASTSALIADRFVHAIGPWYRSAKNAEHELKVMRGVQARAYATGDTHTARKIGTDIATMKRVIAGELGHVKTKLSKVDQRERDVFLAEQATRRAVEAKKLSVDVHPSPVYVQISGKTVASTLLNYNYAAHWARKG